MSLTPHDSSCHCYQQPCIHLNTKEIWVKVKKNIHYLYDPRCLNFHTSHLDRCYANEWPEKNRYPISYTMLVPNLHPNGTKQSSFKKNHLAVGGKGLASHMVLVNVIPVADKLYHHLLTANVNPSNEFP